MRLRDKKDSVNAKTSAQLKIVCTAHEAMT